MVRSPACRKRRRVLLRTALVALAYYLLAFSGEEFVATGVDRPHQRHVQTQYVLGLRLYQIEWTEPLGTESANRYVCCRQETWRGFGLLWRNVVWLD